jgi:hypothetical protein
MKQRDPMSDPIIDELHKVKSAIAKEHDYDVHKLFESIRAWEKKAASKNRTPRVKRSRRQRRAS